MSRKTQKTKHRSSKTGISYFWSEGIHNIFLNGFMSFAAVTIILACLLITGSIVLISYNIDINIKNLQDDSEIMIFIDESVSDEDAIKMKSTIEKIPNVHTVQFQSSEESLNDLRKQLGSESDILDGYDVNNNFMRNAYRITLEDIELAKKTGDKLKEVDGVAKVVIQETTLQMLVKVQQVFRIVAFTLIAALGAISIVIIANTVKLAMFARREEIAIEKMVGATNWFIRWPFVIEGMLLGFISGGLAALAQWGIYEKLTQTVTSAIPQFEMAQFHEFGYVLVAIFLVSGIIIGVGGAVMSMRRFLDV